jgi:hypothetical protein
VATDYMKALMEQMSNATDQTVIPGINKQSSGNIQADLNLFGAKKPAEAAPAPVTAAPVSAPASTPAAQVNASIHKVKLTDDFGDETEIEINLADEASIKELATAKHREKHISSELELLKQQIEIERKKAKELSDKYGKLNMAKSEEEMADLLLNGGLDSLVKRKMQEAAEFEKLSPEAKAELQRRQDEERRKKELDRVQAELDAKLGKIKEAEGKATREAELTLYRQSTAKYCPNDPSKPELNKIHRIVWDEANSEIQKLKAEGVTITAALVDQKFQKAFLSNKALIQSVRGVQSNTVADATRAVVSGDAAVGSGSAATVGIINEPELIARWMGLMTSGKGGEVIKEIQSNPKALKPAYDKLLMKLRGR